jgi:hypothetical protein
MQVTCPGLRGCGVCRWPALPVGLQRLQPVPQLRQARVGFGGVLELRRSQRGRLLGPRDHVPLGSLQVHRLHHVVSLDGICLFEPFLFFRGRAGMGRRPLNLFPFSRPQVK